MPELGGVPCAVLHLGRWLVFFFVFAFVSLPFAAFGRPPPLLPPQTHTVCLFVFAFGFCFLVAFPSCMLCPYCGSRQQKKEKKNNNRKKKKHTPMRIRSPRWCIRLSSILVYIYIYHFRGFEPPRVHTRINSLGRLLVHKLTCGKRESVIDENRRAVGLLNPIRNNNSRQESRGRRDVTCAPGLSGSWKIQVCKK